MRNERAMTLFCWHTLASQSAYAIRSVASHLYRFAGQYRLATLMGLLMTLNALFATAPDRQRIPPNSPFWNTYYGVVRVWLNGVPFGTGSVIHGKQIGNDFWLCVLTANHVVANEANDFRFNPANRVTIAFGNIGGNDPSFDTRLVFTAADTVANPNDPHRQFFGDDRPDLAVIGVKVNQQIFQQVPVYSLAELPQPQFTIVGYGNTGREERDNQGNLIGYTVQNGTGEIKRFANNTVTRRFHGNEPTVPPFFRGEFIEWDLTIGPRAVPGEGVTFPGDSGAPYFVNDPDEIEIEGQRIPIRTAGIMAVHQSGQIVYRNGSLGWGTFLTPGYRQWIEAKCDLVPEPGSLLVLLSGSGWILLFYRRRRVGT